MKLIDFFKRYPDEQSCRDYFREQRQKEGIICRNCKGTSHCWMKTIEQFQCKECRTRTTLRSGTVMESSNLSFSDWFTAMHLMTSTKKGISAKEMQRQLGRKRYEAVWYMMQKIRVAMGARDERYELSGFTEMDEGFFKTVDSTTKGGKKKKLKRGRGSEKQSPVLVMAETEKVKDPKNHRLSSRCKYFKMRVMPDLTYKTINRIVKDSLSPETKVKTDSYSSYNKLNEVVKKHVAKIVPSDQAGTELPWVHIAISNAKRNLLNNFHHVDDTYLQNYLDEFTYRLNRRYFGEKLFGRLLIACISYCWTF
ncbi:MAG: IS1595 family transposase [Porphyromonadaceae bacterium]|nr:MAG: IS1595 family transposase [Porphyromonadaceae bacterium]